MILICPICLASKKKDVYLNSEEERMSHLLHAHHQYEVVWAYNDLLSILERKHAMKNKEILK